MNIIYYGKPFVSGAHQTIGASFLKQEAPLGDTDFAWTAMKQTVSEKYDSIFSLILGNFQSFIIFFLKNIIPYFQKILLELIKFPGYLFFAPGVVLLLSKINKIQLTYFLIPVLGFLIYCIVSFDLRFYIYIAVFLLFFVVYFLFYENFSHNNISFKSRFNLISKIFFIITIFFLSKESFNEMKANITAEPLYLLKIADTIKHDAQNSDIIFARKPHLGYFSHIKTELLPDLDSAELLLQYAKAKGVKYLFYGITEAKARPKLNMLQEPEKLPAAFQLIYAQDFPKAFLYKLALEK
jgi:hypothetical protein